MRNPFKYLIGALLIALIIVINGLFIYKDQFPILIIYNIILINIAILISTAEITDLFKEKFNDIKYSYAIAPFLKAFTLHIIFFYLVILTGALNYSAFSYILASIAIFYLSEMLIASIKVYCVISKYKATGALIDYSKFINTGIKEISLESFPNENKIFIAELIKEYNVKDQNIICELLANAKPANMTGDKEIIFPIIQGKRGYMELLQTSLNDVNNINAQLNKIYLNLVPTGFLAVKYLPLEEYYKNFWGGRKTLSLYIHFVFHFIYRRLLPQMPVIKDLQNIISNGKGKIISKAEIWGRLHYAGFEALSEINTDGLWYILAQKKREKSVQKNPSYYPLIRLKRVGYQGNIFNLYKLRSMRPYSEFIQQKVFELNKLDNAGKLNNDFRITKFGKFIRKYWIDELPQLLNWLKSDIKLVGIRAMSLHYFSLYPDYYKEMYVKVKPGLIPPIFDDANKGINEIAKVELDYLHSYSVSPFCADLKCFFSALNGIFIKGIRSK